MLKQIEKARNLLDAEKPGAALKALAGLKKAKADGEVFYLRGEAWRQSGEFEKALGCYIAGAEATGADRGLRLEILLKTAACRRALGHAAQSLKAASCAVKLARATGLLSADAELELALAWRLAGDFAKAEPALKRLVSQYLRKNDYEAVSFTLWALGGLWRLQGRYKLSIKAFEKATRFADRSGDKAARGYALFGLGGVLRMSGRINAALRAYKETRRLFAGSDDAFARAYAECGLANVLRQQGNLERAESGYLKARRLYASIKDGPDLGFVEWGLGEVYKKRGELSKAAGAFRRAEKLFSSGFEPRGLILTHLSLAQVNYLLGHTARADKLHFAALKEAKKRGLHTYLEAFT